ncbi:MAG: hypothetical protein BGO26_16230 [Actinobacteria bacterium 69-20]|nr:flagellar hook-length control protein FliK [Actinomycetota bacterium]OJV27838.1 MAG: hypothetical protein BGO26_16230 [Actinobacteria bacterium 69-20]
MTGALIDLGPRIGAPSSGSRSGAGSKSDDTPTDAFTDVIEGVISDAAAAARPREHGRAGAHSAGRDDSRRAGSDGNGFVIGGGIDAAADSGHGMARDGSDAAPGMGRHRVGTGPDRSDRTAEDGRGDDTAAEQLGVTIVWSAATHGLPPAPGKHRTPAAHAEPNQVASVQHTTDHAPHPMTSAGLPRATGDASLVPAPVALPVGAHSLRPGGETPVVAPIPSHGTGNPSSGPRGGTAGAGGADGTGSVTVPAAVPAAATPSSRGHSAAAPHSVAHSPAAPSTGPVPAAQGSGAPEGLRVVQEPTGGHARTTPGSGHTVGAQPSAAARGARVAPPLAPATVAAPATPTTGSIGPAGPGGLPDQARAHRNGTGSAATDSAATAAAATTAGAATPAAHLTGTTLAHTTPTAAPAPPPPAPSQPPSQQLSQPDLAGTLAQLRAATDGTYQMRVAVHPAELGGVNVTAIVHHGMLTVTLSPDQTAHHAISQALPQLRAHLADQGFVGVDVGLGSPPQGGNQAGQQGSRTHGGDHATLAGSGDAVDGVDRSTRNARRPSDPTSALDRLL